jgi:hypothetical protein
MFDVLEVESATMRHVQHMNQRQLLGLPLRSRTTALSATADSYISTDECPLSQFAILILPVRIRPQLGHSVSITNGERMAQP